MPFKNPNYTQTPNDLFGELEPGGEVVPGHMAEMGYAELKVVLAVCRLTFGYHRHRTRASITTLEKMTGLSRPAVVAGAAQAEARGLIERVQDGGVTQWIAYVEDNQLSNLTSKETKLVKQVNRTGKAALPADAPTSKATLPPSKKETKKEIRKKDAPEAQRRLTDGQRGFLQLWGAKRFRTNAQKDAVLDMEQSYGTESLLAAARWAAEKGMTLGDGVQAVRGALPKWGKTKQQGDVLKVTGLS